MTALVKRGDILLYDVVRTAGEALIDFGEILEDGPHADTFYHCAIAVDAANKYEATGKQIAEHPVVYDGSWRLFRPPISPDATARALIADSKLIGEPYDDWLIVDDALRDATHNLIHLPGGFITNRELHSKVCSSFLLYHFHAAGSVLADGLTSNVSPQDWFLRLRRYEVQG